MQRKGAKKTRGGRLKESQEGWRVLPWNKRTQANQLEAALPCDLTVSGLQEPGRGRPRVSRAAKAGPSVAPELEVLFLPGSRGCWQSLVLCGYRLEALNVTTQNLIFFHLVMPYIGFTEGDSVACPANGTIPAPSSFEGENMSFLPMTWLSNSTRRNI